MSAGAGQRPAGGAGGSRPAGVGRARPAAATVAAATPDGPASRDGGPRVAVLGLGLVGGSLLLALADAGVAAVGHDVAPGARVGLAARGATVADTLPDALAGAGVVLVCVPPTRTPDVVVDALAGAPGAVVLDVASVKAPVARAVAARAGAGAGSYLPAHPLAGGPGGGHAAAAADLLRGATWAVCPPPVPAPSPGPLLAAAPVLDALDARIVCCTPQEHDRAVGASSHAVHVLAGVVATGALAATPDAPGLTAALSGGALRDVTRVAGADPELWDAIVAANADAVADALDRWAEELGAAAAAVRSGAAGERRERWAAGAAARGRIVDGRWREPAWAPAALGPDWASLVALGRDGVRLRRLRETPDGLVGERADGLHRERR